MNFHELKELISNGESERLEFKRSTGQRTEAAKTVCAMLNGLGGFVLFGVTNTAEIIGQQVGDKTLEDIAAELRRIEPPAFPDIETISLEKGTAVVLLTVPGGSGPYTFDGRAYLRYGPTTIVMPRDEYERRLVERLHATRRWENEPVSDDVSIGDLDAEEIQITLDNAIRLGRLEATDRRDTESILRGLELIRDGHLLNAAVALYGKSDRLKTLYPQMGIRLARFRGTNRLADFSDNRQYWGHTFALLRRAESFLMDHVPIAGHVVPGKMIREDKPWYPPRAIREALANALCHRDYTIPGGAVALAMYDDHLEVTNPGALHFGITPEKLAGPHESKPWNPIIANVFYRSGIIERWGSGTLNMIDWCAENGNQPPNWSEQAGSVFVIFTPAPYKTVAEVTPQVPDKYPTSTRQVTAQLGTESVPSLSQVCPKSVPSDIAARLLVAAESPADLQMLMEQAKHTNRTRFRNTIIRPLIESGLLEPTIPDKPRSSKQRYKITDLGLKMLNQLKEKKLE